MCVCGGGGGIPTVYVIPYARGAAQGPARPPRLGNSKILGAAQVRGGGTGGDEGGGRVEGGLTLPFMALHGLAWPCAALHGLAWPCMALHGPAWPCVALHGLAWPCMALHGAAWPCMALHGLARACMALHDPAWLCMALHGHENSAAQIDASICAAEFSIRIYTRIKNSAAQIAAAIRPWADVR